MFKQKLILVFFLLYAIQSVAQVENRNNGWLSLSNSLKLKNKWGLQLDLNLRSTDQWKYVQVFIIRPGLSYRFNEKVTGIVGFNNNRSRTTVNTTTGYVTEWQIWQQAFIRHRLGPLYTIHRPLLEERLIPVVAEKNGHLTVTERKLGLRFRYLFRNQLPFKKQKTFTKGAYAFTQEDIFLNIGDNDFANNRIFDQFRWFTGLGYRFSPKLDIEAGYLFRSQPTRSTLVYHDHIALLTCFLRL